MNDDRRASMRGRMAVHLSARGRLLFLLAGHLSVMFGIIGLLLPVVPTSPFIILAAYCYARSSERFYLLLLNNKYFGKNIRDWEDHRCVRRRTKIAAMIMVVAMFTLTIFLFFETLTARILVGTIGLFAISCVAMLSVCENKKSFM